MSIEATEAFAWVAEHMPDEQRQALAKFTSMNPGERGIEWWDVLDMLIDCDAHLDIMEPLAERFKEPLAEDGDEWDMLHIYVALTCLYASEAFATTYTDEMRAIAVRATITNNA